MYFQGSQYFASVLSALIIGLISVYLVMPVFHKLQLSSCYDYLELRFSKKVKIFACILYTISLFLYMPIVIYAPALAFSQVTGYSALIIAPIFCAVCIIYTSMVSNRLLFSNAKIRKLNIVNIWIFRVVLKQSSGQIQFNLYLQFVAYLQS